MKSLVIEEGLLLTEACIEYNGNSIFLQRSLIDTGSYGTIVSSEIAEQLGIVPHPDDLIYRVHGVGGSEFVFVREIHCIGIGDMQVRNFPIQVGAMDYGYSLDAIIGLDFLRSIGAIVDIKRLLIYSSDAFYQGGANSLI